MTQTSGTDKGRDGASGRLQKRPLCLPPLRRAQRDRSFRARLTEAEREVASALADGRSYAQIASQRGRSKRTVTNQVVSIFRKLGIGSRRQLAALMRDSASGDGVDASARALGARRARPMPVGLTERESQIFAYAETGRSNKGIARDLGLSPSTVGVLLARARAKLRALQLPDADRSSSS